MNFDFLFESHFLRLLRERPLASLLENRCALVMLHLPLTGRWTDGQTDGRLDDLTFAAGEREKGERVAGRWSGQLGQLGRVPESSFSIAMKEN